MQSTIRQELIDQIGVQVDKSEVTSGPIKTAYLSVGDGQPVVLLHGAGAGAVTWRTVMGSLSAQFHVIAPDIVGYGESDKPSASYDRPYFSAWFGDFLDRLGLQKTSIVGSSQGGAIALQFAIENPERVEKLVLVDSGALGKGMPLGAFLGLIWMNTLPSIVASRWIDRYLVHNQDNIDESWAAYSLQVARMPGGNRVFWQGKGQAVSPIPQEQLRQITQQTLIIWGEEDKFFPLSHAQIAKQMIPNSQLHIIPNAGHLPFLDQPAAFNEVLIRFLQEEPV